MKKIFASVALTLMCAGVATASIDVTFNENDLNRWTVGNNGTKKIEDGHLVVEMGAQSNGKYRADLSYTDKQNPLVLNPTEDKYLAIKFIGTKPQGNMTFEFRFTEKTGDTDNTWCNNVWTNNKYQGTETTAKGNTIYYYELSKAANYDVERSTYTLQTFQFKMADCTVAPYAYTVDWIKSYPSLEALKEDVNHSDDGEGEVDDKIVYPVVNETTGAEYQSFDDAIWAVAAGTENTLVLNQDVELAKRFNPGSNIKINVVTADGSTLVINRPTRFNNNSNSKTMFSFELGYPNNYLGFSNVIFKSAETSGDLFAVKDGTVRLTNVSEEFILNTGKFHLSLGNGNDKKAYAYLTDVSLRNVKVNTDGELYLNGNCAMDVTLAGAASVVAVAEGGELTNEKAIRLTYQTLPEVGAVVVRNCKEAGKFYLTNAGYSLVADGENLVLADAPEEPVLTVNGAEVVSTQLKEGDVVSVTAPEGYTVWYKITDAEPAAALLAAGQLAGYTDSGENAMTYTVEKGKVVSFICANADQSKVSVPYTFTIAADGTVTGIEAVETEEAENAPVEWYTMQGVRVAEPADGLFIRKQGNKVTKVIVK